MLVEYWPPGIIELGNEPLAVLDVYRQLGHEITVLGAGLPALDNDQILESSVASPGSLCNLILRPLA